MDKPVDAPLRLAAKVRLAVRVWVAYLRVRRGLRRVPLPAFVNEFGAAPVARHGHSPALLSLAVHRSLNVGPFRPRCLVGALVLYRLLREQGDAAELVIGLPPDPRGHAAHAWVELGGREVGPPPGKGGHAEMARFS
jgi:Transglutaminase-like superfamily